MGYEILMRSEMAVRSWLKTKELGKMSKEQLYTGTGRGFIIKTHEFIHWSKSNPYVSIRCPNASIQDDYPYSGVWRVTMDVVIQANLNELKESQMEVFVDDILALFNRDEAGPEISAHYGDFHIFNFLIPITQSKEVDDDMTQFTATYEFDATGANIKQT